MRSAAALTVTLALMFVLFAEFGSVDAVVVAVAVLVIVPGVFPVRTNVIVSVAPTPSVAIVQVMGPVPAQEAPAVELTELKVPPLKVSVSVIALVGAGPLLVTPIVKVDV